MRNVPTPRWHHLLWAFGGGRQHGGDSSWACKLAMISLPPYSIGRSEGHHMSLFTGTSLRIIGPNFSKWYTRSEPSLHWQWLPMSNRSPTLPTRKLYLGLASKIRTQFRSEIIHWDFISINTYMCIYIYIPIYMYLISHFLWIFMQSSYTKWLT